MRELQRETFTPVQSTHTLPPQDGFPARQSNSTGSTSGPLSAVALTPFDSAANPLLSAAAEPSETDHRSPFSSTYLESAPILSPTATAAEDLQSLVPSNSNDQEMETTEPATIRLVGGGGISGLISEEPVEYESAGDDIAADPALPGVVGPHHARKDSKDLMKKGLKMLGGLKRKKDGA